MAIPDDLTARFRAAGRAIQHRLIETVCFAPGG
jgi:hypothetical protein